MTECDKLLKNIEIDGVKVGPECPPYIIAELSANHNGSIDKALQTISMAKACGANAIKLQTYTADTLTIDCNKEDFLIKDGLWDGYSLYDLYKEAHTPYEWHKELFYHASKEEITCFSSPFDESAVDFLEDLNAPAYKIASFEAVDLPLIRYVASTRKPMIISTGMANLEEIEEAVDTARNAGCSQLVLLHCISGYPAPIDQCNLRTINDMQQRFGSLIGLSDHTLGIAASVGAVSLGARVIEKHVTLSREDKGPDSEFSLEPHELKELCSVCNDVWRALGNVGYERKKIEQENVRFRRSLYIVSAMKKGDVLTPENLRRIRPGFGMKPKMYDELLGKQVNRDVERGTPMDESLID